MRPKSAAGAEGAALERLKVHMVRINMALLSGVLVGVLAVLLLVMNAQNQRTTNDALNRMLNSRMQPGAPGERPLFGGILIEYGAQQNVLRQVAPPDLSADTVKQMTELALKSQKERGEVGFGGYSFAFAKQTINGTNKLVFVDQANRRELMRNALLICAGGGALSLLALWGLSVYLAGRAVRPVREAFGRQKTFVADASHELKTPLAIMSANLSLLRDSTGVDDPRGRYIAAMEGQQTRMTDLIADMLTLARLDEGKSVLAQAPVDFSELVGGELLSFEAFFFEEGLALTQDIAPGILVTGDETALRQLVGILLDNACRHTPAGGVVCVSLAAEHGRAVFAVENPGSGIPAEHLPHVFDRFYRADSARSREDGGFGLGLAIAHAIAQAHRAEITAQSEPGKTTRFAATFPLAGKQ